MPWKFAEKSWKFPLKGNFFEKPWKAKKFVKICLRYFCTISFALYLWSIERLAWNRFVDRFSFEFTTDRSCLYITHAAGTNQAWNSLGNKTIEPIRYQLNASEYFCLVTLAKFWKVPSKDNMLFQQSLERIIYTFWDFEFSLSQLINIHEKIGTWQKSPDNLIVRIIEVRIIEVRLYEDNWTCWAKGVHAWMQVGCHWILSFVLLLANSSSSSSIRRNWVFYMFSF